MPNTKSLLITEAEKKKVHIDQGLVKINGCQELILKPVEKEEFIVINESYLFFEGANKNIEWESKEK